MRAVMGTVICCPVCGRAQSAVELIVGEAWMVCWHKRCLATFWVMRLTGTVASASDVEAGVGARLAAALLMSYAPAPLVMLAVPEAARPALAGATQARIVERLTQLLVPPGAIQPAKVPRQKLPIDGVCSGV